MRFESVHIKGKGRGKPMGFPTINLKIPENFELEDGIYAVKVNIEKKIFKGALHYGPVPTFAEEQQSLEVYLIDYDERENLNEKIVKVAIIKYLRPVINFRSKEELIKQIEEDVKNIKSLSTQYSYLFS